ncbi:hypothetical protein AJ79_07339 [Helicocarpus griseus UAMH5409]|uniref:Uncharacterized protein n=1 Tax=Helicocarpus griseus UAMH5409 TaxID=1447875 RepID=A0A2B7X422_9EURO|nr:hypothetical protein AJ79_07339 [Helicocarpus griseus UAMH5409]
MTDGSTEGQLEASRPIEIRVTKIPDLNKPVDGSQTLAFFPVGIQGPLWRRSSVCRGPRAPIDVVSLDQQKLANIPRYPGQLPVNPGPGFPRRHEHKSGPPGWTISSRKGTLTTQESAAKQIRHHFQKQPVPGKGRTASFTRDPATAATYWDISQGASEGTSRHGSRARGVVGPSANERILDR